MICKHVNHGSDYITGKGGGVIQGTASEAVLVVLLAARDKILRTVGRSALPKLVTYGSDQTHSSLQKACQVWLVTLQLKMSSDLLLGFKCESFNPISTRNGENVGYIREVTHALKFWMDM